METDILTYNKHIHIDERGGSLGNKTNLERLWDSIDGPYSVRTKRNTVFAPHSHMTSTMLQYELTPFSISDKDSPDLWWVRENALSFIRNESPSLLRSEISETSDIDLENKYIDASFLDDFIDASAWTNKIRIPVPKNYLDEEDVATSIYNNVLTRDNIVGSNKNAENNKLEEFRDQVKPTLMNKGRLMFLIPGMPFKDQNLFRTPHLYDVDTPDLCEIAFFVKLDNIVESIYQVCPFGTDMVILSDGELYADIFHVETDKVKRYLERVIDYRNKLNYHGSLSILNLKEMINRVSPNGEAWKIVDSIQQQIKTLLLDDEVFSKSFDNLIRGMKWNLNSKKLLKSIPRDICLKILKDDKESLPEEYHDIWNQYHIIAHESAIKYCSRNLMLRWTDLLRLYFPEAIRGTMHPKENQFALSADCFPWNGVAYSEKWPESIDDIKVKSFSSIVNKKNLKLICFKDTHFPCCFTIAEGKTRNIDLARRVMTGHFKSSDWGGYTLRSFKNKDFEDLVELAKGDPDFTWERTEQSEKQWKDLFDFRQNHYSEHKFGVLGVWSKDNKLIGQFGLQVLDQERDEVEIVIFLGKDYTKKGLGTKLMNHLLMRCKAVGLDTLYAVVRIDNEASNHFISKFGGRAIKMRPHYNYTGIQYKITV